MDSCIKRYRGYMSLHAVSWSGVAQPDNDHHAGMLFFAEACMVLLVPTVKPGFMRSLLLGWGVRLIAGAGRALMVCPPWACVCVKNSRYSCSAEHMFMTVPKAAVKLCSCRLAALQ